MIEELPSIGSSFNVEAKLPIPNYLLTFASLKRLIESLVLCSNSTLKIAVRTDGVYRTFNSVEELFNFQTLRDRFKPDLRRRRDLISLKDVRFKVNCESGELFFGKNAIVKGTENYVTKCRELIAAFFEQNVTSVLHRTKAESTIETNLRVSLSKTRSLIYEATRVSITFTLFVVSAYLYLAIFFSTWFFYTLSYLVGLGDFTVDAITYFLVISIILIVMISFLVFLTLNKIYTFLMKKFARKIKSRLLQGKNTYGLTIMLSSLILFIITIAIFHFFPQIEGLAVSNANPSNPYQNFGSILTGVLDDIATYTIYFIGFAVPIVGSILSLLDRYNRRRDPWLGIEDRL